MEDVVMQIGKLIHDEPTVEGKQKIALAEKDTIRFYYDMVGAASVKALTGETDWPDASAVQNAVQVFNQACEAQHKPCLFTKDINSMEDLYEFSTAVAMPENAAQ